MNALHCKIKTTDSVNFCADFDKPLIYFPNYGNLGDALIATGAKMAFEKIGVTVNPVDSLEKNPDSVLIYAGGGNLVSYYNDCARFLMATLKKQNKVILLPHTVNGHEPLLNMLDQRHHIFCREAISYNYLSNYSLFSSYFDHDLALRIDPDLLFAKYEILSNSVPDKVIRMVEIILAKSILHSRINDRVGYLFRSDKESVRDSKSNYFDISGLINAKWFLNNYSSLFSSVLLMSLSVFDRIFTDRLHVAIGASLLGIPTTLYNNSYYKNAAVFDASLSTSNACINFENLS